MVACVRWPLVSARCIAGRPSASSSPARLVWRRTRTCPDRYCHRRRIGATGQQPTPHAAAASERLTTPPTWTNMGEFEEPGSSRMCIVSCPHAAVTLMFRAGGQPGSACETIREQVDEHIAPTHADPYAPCGWRAPVPGAGSSATVTAATVSAAELRDAPTIYPGLAPISPTDDATYVTVFFSGGPT